MKKLATIAAFLALTIFVTYSVKTITKQNRFDPTKYTAKQISEVEQKCTSSFFTKEVIEPLMVDLCKQLGRKIESCTFTGFETLLGRDQWLIKCEREELEKLGSI